MSQLLLASMLDSSLYTVTRNSENNASSLNAIAANAIVLLVQRGYIIVNDAEREEDDIFFNLIKYPLDHSLLLK